TGGTAMDTYLRLFDASGTQVAANDDASGLYSRIDYSFAKPGTYYIGVSGYPDSDYKPNTGGSGSLKSATLADYRLTLGLDHGDTLANAVDTGLSSAAARPVSFTEALGNGTRGAEDVDLYKFTASAGDRLAASTGLPTGGVPADTYLRLFDAAGGQLAFNNDAGKTGYSSLAYTFPAGGTSYIRRPGYPHSPDHPQAACGAAVC